MNSRSESNSSSSHPKYTQHGFSEDGSWIAKKSQMGFQSSIALPTKIKSNSIASKTEPTRISTRSESLSLKIECAPKPFYLATINSRSESNSIPSSPKSTQQCFSEDRSWIAKKISDGVLVIHCPSNENELKFHTTSNWCCEDFYTLGIARLTNRIRSKIFLSCSDKLAKRIQFDHKLPQIHPTLNFRDWVLDCKNLKWNF